MAGFETAGEPCVDREDDFDRVDDYDIAASDEDSLDTMCLSYEDSITAFETSDEECADIEDDSDREEKILDQFDDEELATASTAYIYSLLGSSSSSGGESASENGDIRNSSDPEIADSNPADLYNGGPLYRESSAALQPDENTTAYAIAQDMIGKCDFVLIGSGVYCFNGIVHELLDDITLGRLILKHERMYVEAIGKVAIISNIRDFIKLEERLVLDTHEISDAYIVFRNGRYNMKKRRFEKNKANNFQTSYLDFDYDEGACGCKWFIQYLEVLTGGNDGLKILVLEVMGYIFSNNMSAKKVFFAVGPGDTGKSLFLKLVASFFPAKYVSNIDLCKFDDKFTSGSLVDMRLNIGGDLPNKVLSPDVIQIVKEITGGDKMQARKMYQQSFPYITTCKLLFATNHNINMKYNDEQFVERSVILPFMNKVPKDKQIRDLIEKLKPERAAIFNMALQAYFRLEKNNFVFSEVVNSADFVRGTCVTHEEVSYADSAIRQFVDASCEVSDSAEAFETVADLHAAFSKFYAEKYNLNIDKDAFSKAFKQYAQDMGLEYKQKNKGRGYIGIKLIK